MADRMLVFPSRAPSAVTPSPDAAPEAALPSPASAADSAPMHHRGLFLIKGDRLAVESISARRQSSRISQTRMIVAQVEREIAAIAARRQSERFGRVHSMPAAGADPVPRDTPLRVVSRLLRLLRRDW